MSEPAESHVLERLYAVIEDRKTADPKSSYTAKLFQRGPAQIAKKLGEEATETVIEGVRGDKAALTAESADLLYHLLALWAASGIQPAEVWNALEEREGLSGLTEKARREVRD